MKKLFAFTLSELLIALSIIGVIAALTVPGLISNYQKNVNITQIRKFTNDLENSLDMFLTEEGKTKLVSTGIFSNSTNANAFFNSKFNVMKTCEANAEGCFATSYTSADGGNFLNNFKCKGTSYVLKNSIAICVNSVKEPITENINDVPTSFGGYIELYVDTNGVNGPNIGGRDMFLVYLRDTGLLASTIESNHPDAATTMECGGEGQDACPTTDTCASYASGRYCLLNLMQNNWEMNY